VRIFETSNVIYQIVAIKIRQISEQRLFDSFVYIQIFLDKNVLNSRPTQNIHLLILMLVIKMFSLAQYKVNILLLFVMWYISNNLCNLIIKLMYRECVSSNGDHKKNLPYCDNSIRKYEY